MSLPRPSFSFAIPSVYDGVLLDCRLYQPKTTFHSEAVSAAIVAHPYAPLGGSYDDPIVDDIATVLLREGQIVGLFNLRGAENSEGRTSWSAKPELADYVSFYGFMLHYLHLANSHLIDLPSPQEESVYLRTSEASAVTAKPRLILGGYSYGSLLAMHLPRVEEVIQIFKQPSDDSSEAVIRKRAADLVKDWIRTSEEHMMQSRGRQRHNHHASGAISGSLSVAFGDESASRRTSRDSKRSLDIEGLRKSVDQVRARLHFGRSESNGDLKVEGRLEETQITVPFIQHLLVSPLLPPVSNFLTMFSRPSFGSQRDGQHGGAQDVYLTLRPTLVVYGDSDPFTSKRKLRKWAESLTKASKSRFQFKEIKGAGHFWRRTQEQEMLQMAIRDWLRSTKHSQQTSKV